MEKIRNENEDMTDDESITYFESEECEESPLEYGIKQKFLDFFVSFKIFFFLSGCSLIGLSLLIDDQFHFSNLPFDEQLSAVPNPETPLIKTFVLYCGISFILFIILGFIVYFLTMEYLKKAKGAASYCYYFNEVSYHMAAIAVCLIMFKAFHNYEDFILFQALETHIYFFYSIKSICIAIALLACIKVFVKYVSMRFNYNMYMNQIRKCILFDLFVSLLSSIHEDESLEFYNKIDEFFNLAKPKAFFILQKNFRKEDASNLSFGEKRLLIKEFLELTGHVSYYSDNLPAILAKIKEKSKTKAGKLFKKLKSSNKLKKVEDLEKYFSDKQSFQFMIKELGFEQDKVFNKHDIAAIIEKTFKDRYVIKKNLKQINAAISRLHISIELVTVALTCIFIVIKETIKLGQLAGLVSAFFGTQFISNFLSGSVIQSVIFLFIIHPYDIGDRVMIRLHEEEENFIVGELNILSTTFYKYDNTSYFVPNRILVNKPVCNIRRSGATMESHTIHVSSRTDSSKIERLKEMLIVFCRKHPEHYTDYILINYDKIEESNKLCLKVLMQHRMNCQHYGKYLKRRSEFVNELNRSLKECKISYKLPVQRVRMR